MAIGKSRVQRLLVENHLVGNGNTGNQWGGAMFCLGFLFGMYSHGTLGIPGQIMGLCQGHSTTEYESLLQ